MVHLCYRFASYRINTLMYVVKTEVEDLLQDQQQLQDWAQQMFKRVTATT